MKTSFQSGDIQLLLGAPKQRIEYLSLKIPIRPELEQVSGTGKANLYSFRNSLQFAIAQEVSNLGLYLTEIRSILDTIQKLSDGDNGTEIQVTLAAGKFSGARHKKLVETVRDGAEALKGFFSDDATPRNAYLVLFAEAKSHQDSNEASDSRVDHLWFPVPDLRDVLGTARQVSGLVALNLGKIRARLVGFADQEA